MNNQNRYHFLNKKILSSIGFLIIIICAFIALGVLLSQIQSLEKTILGPGEKTILEER